MKLGRMLIAAILLAGLSAALWWSNRSEKEKEGKPAKDAPPKILTIDGSKIQQIEITPRTGEPTTIQNDGGTWKITAPKPLAADQSAVGEVTSTVTDLNSTRVVDPNVTDLAAYGLAPAADTITIAMQDGKTTKLLIGDNTPTGSDLYAKVDGDSRLFTVSPSVKGAVDKSSRQLRNKHLMNFDNDKISRVELTVPKKTPQPLEFGRANSEWQILKPKPLRADGFQVDELVRKLHEAAMDTAASEEELKKGVAAFASSPVVGIAKVTDSSGTQTLEIRKEKDDYYAKSSFADGVYLVSKELGEGVDKSLEDFRNKKLFDFAFSEPVRLEYKDGGKNTVYQKIDETWMLDGKKMDGPSMQVYIDDLRDLAGTKFVDSGFTTPQLELTVVSDNGKRTEKVEIAPAGNDFIARRAGDSTLYYVEGKSIQNLRQGASDIRPAAPPAAPAKK